MRSAALIVLLGALVGGAALSVSIAAPDESERGDGKKADSQVDRMAVARVLFADGFYDRAEVVLDKIGSDEEGIDAAEYWMIRGLVARNLGKFDNASDYFLAAIAAGSKGPKVHLLRAQALDGAERYEEALRAIQGAPDQIREFPESFLLEAQILYRLERKHASFEVLDRGFSRYPDNEKIERQRMFLLMELGLYQAAADAVEHFFAHHESQAQDYIAFALALQKNGQLKAARDLLEQANLRFPNHRGVRSRLASAYYQLGHPVIAAEVLRPLAWLDVQLAQDTAELYRKGGAYGRATRMNQRVEDQRAKFRQRLSLLLEQEKYELAANLYARIARLGLLEEQPIVYAMAYAFFQTRDFDRAEQMLGQLTDEKLFKQGIAIRREIEACRRASWQCN